MYLGQANTGSPDLIPLVLEAWNQGYSGERVVLYICHKTGCTIGEAKDAIEQVYLTMKD